MPSPLATATFTEGVCSFLYVLYTADFVKDYGFVLVAEGTRRKAQSRLHYAACSAEYCAAAGCLAEGVVKVAFRKVGKVEARLLYHFGKLARGERRIGIVAELVAGDFKLFGRAGYYRNDVQIFGLYALLHAVVRFEHCAEHLLRGLAGREVGNEVWIVMFEELDPRGAAACEHRRSAAVFKPGYELRGLLHNGEVGGYVHIETLYVAELLYGGDHFALHIGAYGQAERLSKRCADGRRGIEYHLLFIVDYRAPDIGHGRLFVERAYGAGHYALSAVYAGREGKRHIVGRAYDLCIAAVFGAYCSYRLVFARSHAARAEYAL